MVPRAGDDAIFEFPASERRAHMRAEVVDGAEVAAIIEYGYELAVDGNSPAALLGDIGSLAYGDKLTHRGVRLLESRDLRCENCTGKAQGVAMLEVEVKFAVDDPDALKAALAGWRPQGMRTDEDHYFLAPDRDFAVTDEALRVRSIGSKNWVTYKGPRRDEATKTRLELELPLADGIEAAGHFRRLLEHLGYRPVGLVRKTRQVFASARDGFVMQATLDNVEQVGTYAEVEIVAKESDYDRARALVLQVAGELGMKQAERRSYLQLTLAKQRPMAALRSVSTIAELRTAVAGARNKKLTIGLVPTMGALHEGHAALMDRARSECGFVVVTIFVNPTQFGPSEDLSRYPRTWESDLELCERHAADLVFAPQPSEVYPEGFRHLCRWKASRRLSRVHRGQDTFAA